MTRSALLRATAAIVSSSPILRDILKFKALLYRYSALLFDLTVRFGSIGLTR